MPLRTAGDLLVKAHRRVVVLAFLWGVAWGVLLMLVAK